MNYKEYYWKHPEGTKGKSSFTHHHFTEAGLGIYTDDLDRGLPEIHALRLVNKWNQNSHGWRYWL